MLINDPQTHIATAAEAIAPHLIAIRRDLHAHPELAFQETRTAGVVAAELTRLGIPHRTGVGGTGVIGTIAGTRPGPTLILRADMDALPILEQTGLAYASTVLGRMHACGHDIHTATLLGAAAVLAGMADGLAGSVRLVFQPAEEIGTGARAMIADGVMDGADFAIGFHNYPGMPVGRLGFCRGGCMAAVDVFDIAITGRSGHAAHPDECVDPIAAAAFLITQLQTIVAREIRPTHACVVTIAAIHAGDASNTIPDLCTVRGTVRTLDPAVRDQVEAALRRICAGVDASMRVTSEVSYVREIPPTVNDGPLLDRVMAAVGAQLGDVVDEGEPSLGGEDFALMAEMVPSCHVRVGAGLPGRHDRLHNSDYQPAEGCIALGVQALARAAVEVLR